MSEDHRTSEGPVSTADVERRLTEYLQDRAQEQTGTPNVAAILDGGMSAGPAEGHARSRPSVRMRVTLAACLAMLVGGLGLAWGQLESRDQTATTAPADPSAPPSTPTRAEAVDGCVLAYMSAGDGLPAEAEVVVPDPADITSLVFDSAVDVNRFVVALTSASGSYICHPSFDEEGELIGSSGTFGGPPVAGLEPEELMSLEVWFGQVGEDVVSVEVWMESGVIFTGVVVDGWFAVDNPLPPDQPEGEPMPADNGPPAELRWTVRSGETFVATLGSEPVRTTADFEPGPDGALPTRQLDVAAVVGVELTDATELLDAGLAVEVVRESSDVVPDGVVITQSLEPYRFVPEGTRITLVVSSGPEGDEGG